MLSTYVFVIGAMLLPSVSGLSCYHTDENEMAASGNTNTNNNAAYSSSYSNTNNIAASSSYSNTNNNNNYAASNNNVNAANTGITGVTTYTYGTGNPGIEPGYTRTSVMNARIVNNCQTCQKFTVMSNTVNLRYTQTRYQCVTSAGTGVGADATCRASASMTAYLDGSMGQKSCTCCGDLCNNANFCTENDQTIQTLMTTYGGELSHRCGAVQQAQPAGLVSLTTFAVAAIVARL